MNAAKKIALLVGVSCILISSMVFGESGWSNPDPGDFDNPWSDFAEAKPDVYPDAWSMDKLVKYSDDEIMLRSSNGAMLRWVPMSQINTMEKVRREVSKAAEIRVDFFLTKGEQPNAAAGKREGRPTMFVNFAMMDLIEEDADMWAALIGHEIAHLKLGHIDKHVKRQIPLAILKTLAQTATAGDPLTSTASGLLVDGVGLKFSRDAERQSDYMGVIWSIESGYDAKGAARLHSLMAERSSTFSIPFLASHPSSKERIETLSELADRLSP